MSQPGGGSVGFCRLRPFWSVRPVPMHSRHTTHLPSCGGSTTGAHQVHPDPLHIEHRAFSGICLSLWAIATEHTLAVAGDQRSGRRPDPARDVRALLRG